MSCGNPVKHGFNKVVEWDKALIKKCQDSGILQIIKLCVFHLLKGL